VGYYLPFEKINIRLLNQFFSNKKSILANAKYDIKALKKYGVEVKVDEGIILLSHVLNTMRDSNSLKSLSWHIGLGHYDKNLNTYIKKHKVKNYLTIPHYLLKDYAVIDAIATYRVWEYLMEQLVPRQKKVYEMYKKTLIPSVNTYVDIEGEGIPIDKDRINELNDALLEEELILEKEIQTFFGNKIMLSSPEQLAIELKKLGLPDYGRTKKGHYQTGNAILQMWDKEGYEIASLILKYREFQKLRTGFVGKIEDESTDWFKDDRDKSTKKEGMTKFLCDDGKIHPSYGVGMTEPLRQFCISGDSLLTLSTGEKISIKDFYSKNKKINNNYVLTHRGNYKKIKNCFKNGKKEVFKLKLKNGKELKLTEDHKVFTNNGWKQVNDLDIKVDKVMSVVDV
jgi:hypothetical protein